MLFKWIIIVNTKTPGLRVKNRVQSKWFKYTSVSRNWTVVRVTSNAIANIFTNKIHKAIKRTGDRSET